MTFEEGGAWVTLAVAGALAIGGLGYATAQLFTTKSSRQNAIFVSFRPEDEPNFAGRLCDRLIDKFGTRNIFVDVPLLASGRDVDAILEKSLSQCRTLIVIVGRRWNSALDERERRKTDDPADYVRREVEVALQRRLRVVPILVDGADLPESSSLPEGLRPLTRYNAFEMSHADFSSDSDRLIRALKRARV